MNLASSSFVGIALHAQQVIAVHSDVHVQEREPHTQSASMKEKSQHAQQSTVDYDSTF